MTFSISASTPFSKIDWSTFENRPPINESMPFCENNDGYKNTKCCVDEYSIEHVLEVAHRNNLADMPEVKFIDQYPCLNMQEIDSLADKIDEMIPEIDEHNQTPQFPRSECVTQSIFDGLKRALPTALLESIRPYLCRAQ